MAQQQFGDAQPIADFFRKIVNFAGPDTKPSGGSSTDAGTIPKAWEEANERSVEQDLGKPAGRKTPKRRVRSRKSIKKASLARKR